MELATGASRAGPEPDLGPIASLERKRSDPTREKTLLRVTGAPSAAASADLIYSAQAAGTLLLVAEAPTGPGSAEFIRFG